VPFDRSVPTLIGCGHVRGIRGWSRAAIPETELCSENAPDSKTGMGLSVHRGLGSPLSAELAVFCHQRGKRAAVKSVHGVHARVDLDQLRPSVTARRSPRRSPQLRLEEPSSSPANLHPEAAKLTSDRALRLAKWCPTCRVMPGARCRRSWLWKTREATPLHVARGWRARRCPTCKADPGGPCWTPSGREASHSHQPRLRPGRFELVSDESIWQELEALGATMASVLFSGRAGRAGRVDRIMLSRQDGGELVDVERWSGRDELCYALEAPDCWDRRVDHSRSACRDRGPTRRKRFEEVV
jgi:hypothetical protein